MDALIKLDIIQRQTDKPEDSVSWLSVFNILKALMTKQRKGRRTGGLISEFRAMYKKTYAGITSQQKIIDEMEV